MASFGLPLVLLCIFLFIRDTLTVTIQYTSPGKTLADAAGVFKVKLDVDSLLGDHTTYQTESIVEQQFTCARVGDKNHTRLNIKALSFDYPTTRTYIQLDEGSDDTLTALYGDTCDPNTKGCELDKVFHAITDVKTYDKGLINSLSSWDGSAYFLYTPEGRKAVYFGYRPYLEIRQVRDGYTFPPESEPESEPLNVDLFSTILTRITITSNTRKRWLQAGSTLLVLPADGSGLVLLTVVRAALFTDPPRNNTLEEFGYALISSRVGGETADEAVVLHMSEDTWNGWYKYKLELEGGVSYSEGTLCWSTADSVRCGVWSPEQPLAQPTDVRTVLQAGQSAQIFQGLLSSEVYSNVTTGIALAESPTSNGRLVLFFGCLATFEGTGGFGMLVQRSPESEIEVFGISDKNGPLLGGAMVIVPDLLQCNEPPYVHITPPSTSSSSGSSGHVWSSIEFCLLCFVCLSLFLNGLAHVSSR